MNKEMKHISTPNAVVKEKICKFNLLEDHRELKLNSRDYVEKKINKS